MESIMTAPPKHLSPRHLAMYEMSRRELLEQYIHQNGHEESDHPDKPRRMSVDPASDEELDREEAVTKEREEDERRRVMEEQRRIIEEQRRIVEEQRRRLVEEQQRQLMEEEDEERRLLMEEHRRRLMREEREGIHDKNRREEEEEEEEGNEEEMQTRDEELRVRRDAAQAHIDLNMMRANSHLKEIINKNRRFSSPPGPTEDLSPRHTNGSIHDSDSESYLTHRAAHGGSPDLPHSFVKASHPLIKNEEILEKTDIDIGLKDDLKTTSMDDPDGEKPQTEWSFEEQFKQLYELSADPKRKEFLDDLFSFMQKRGTPVNRIPIMAKQVLDLYELYNLVVAKGGLVEVINKKQWREITKGLNLPASITSAAFTLRTQYMKYLYPYECEKKNLSSPSELQSAIDGNRREGRRPSYHSPHMHSRPPSLAYHGLDLHTPTGSPPPTMIPHPSRIPTLPSRLSPSTSPGEDDHIPLTLPRQGSLSHAAMLAELAERGAIPPPSKRSLLAEEHHQRLLHLQQQHLLMPTAHLKVSSARAHPESGMPLFEVRGDNSLVMSIELNGVFYQGVLYPRGAPGHPLIGIPIPRSSASPK
ncbi:protein dead ringer homolog [Diadema antillarum]|uniref:protein dead ringer homolog n=1 Tax=Diadema antillarum TaxID=105358 RepID=UPI003A84A86C